MFILNRKFYTAIACCALTWNAWAQDIHTNYNFEIFEDNQPVGWSIDGESTFIPMQDFENFKEGKASLRLEMPETDEVNPMFVVTKVLPTYKGKKLVFSGYIKTDGDDFQMTPIIRIDPNIDFVSLPENVKGTTDWKKYELIVELKPEQTQQIVLGTYMLGKGTIWLDDFKVTIDGKDVSTAEIFKFPAVEDHTFDKGSDVVFPSLDANQMDNLALLGRVWGFLKYHHPAIAQGKYNWDYELFRFLPQYLQVTSSKQRDALLLQWIEQLGMVKLCDTCAETSKEAVLKPNLNWMDTYQLSDELRHKIAYIYANRTQEEQYYVSKGFNQNAVFPNELSYEEMEFPDAGFRLISLYRLWNIMQYYMPNRHITDRDWEEVLRAHIQSFIEAKDRLAYE